MVPPIRTSLLSAIFFNICSLCCLAGFNLTPVDAVMEREGSNPIKCVSFRNDLLRILYQPPAGWSYSGTPQAFSAHSDGFTPATATIEKLPLNPSFTLDDLQMKRAAEEVLASVPKGCEKIALVSQAKNDFDFCAKGSVETIVTYVVFGRPMEMSVLALAVAL